MRTSYVYTTRTCAAHAQTSCRSTWLAAHADHVLVTHSASHSVGGYAYITLSELSYVHGEQLERNDGEDSLETVLCVRNLQRLVREVLRLLVVLVADQDRIPLQNTAIPQGRGNP